LRPRAVGVAFSVAGRPYHSGARCRNTISTRCATMKGRLICWGLTFSVWTNGQSDCVCERNFAAATHEKEGDFCNSDYNARAICSDTVAGSSGRQDVKELRKKRCSPGRWVLLLRCRRRGISGGPKATRQFPGGFAFRRGFLRFRVVTGFGRSGKNALHVDGKRGCFHPSGRVSHDFRVRIGMVCWNGAVI